MAYFHICHSFIAYLHICNSFIRDPFIRLSWLIYISVTWLIYVCDMTHLHMCGMKRSYEMTETDCRAKITSESWHTYEYVMLHVWMSHITRINESWHVWNNRDRLPGEDHKWVMAYLWRSHVARMNESCHTYQWVISRIESQRQTAGRRSRFYHPRHGL